MKKIRFIILLVSFVLCATNVAAQSVRIYKNDVTTKLDSIVSVSAVGQNIEIYKDDGTTISVPYAELDSIVSVKEPVIEFVDLGLSVKWATCNVGAQTPYECGDYFAWGETLPKSSYGQENSKAHDKNMADISGNSAYDAARANWGAPARIPTNEEIAELCDRCIWRWILYRNIHGMLITGPNGNSIFLPAAGFCIGSAPFSIDKQGYYLSSTPFDATDKAEDSYYLEFDRMYRYTGNWIRRYLGQPVRPVCDK